MQFEMAPGVAENEPAGQKTHDDVEVEKYEPAAQGAKAVNTINPLPPFPVLNALPGNPPTPTPDTYPFTVIML